MKVILDTDPGTDDAIAMLWLLALDARYKVELIAVTSTAGNVPRDQTFANAARLLRLCHRDDIEVGRAVLEKVTDDVRRHGDDGLAGTSALLPRPNLHVSDARASEQIIADLVREHPGEITIIAIGPASNLAAAERLAPGTLASARRVILLGGDFHPGNERPEFNVSSDPGAWRAVLERARDIAIVPLDVTRNVMLSSSHVAAAGIDMNAGVVGQFIRSLCDKLTMAARKHGAGGFAVHDAIAVGCCCYPESLRLVPARIEVGREGPNRGRTSVARYGRPNAMLAQTAQGSTLGKHLIGDLAYLSKRVQ